MNKLIEIRKALGKVLFNFEEVEVEGTVYLYDALEVGAEVYIFDENGEKVPAPDVTFEVEDKKVTVKDGKIESIEEIEVEEEETEEVEMEDETEGETTTTDIEALEARVTTLELQVATLVENLTSTIDVVEEFASQEEGEKIEKKDKVKEVPVSGAARFFENI